MSHYPAQQPYGQPAQQPYGQSQYGQGQLPHFASPHGAGAQQQTYGAPAQSYGAPTQSYGAPAQSYGAPAQSYGAQGGHAAYGAPQGHGQSAGGYGQSGQHGSYGQPAGQRPRQDLRMYFDAVDQDRSGQISAIELASALVNGDFSAFDPATVGILLRMFDRDGSGAIGFDEFAALWAYIEQWQNAFRKADRDRSGTIEPQELETALRSFGYSLSPPTILSLIRKHAPKTPQRGPGGFAVTQAPQKITFDNFIRICVSVRSLTEAFQARDQGRTGYVQFGYEDFLAAAVSAP